MSRIDEALRRAAEEAGNPSQAGVAPMPVDDIAELASEAYQTEERAPVHDMSTMAISATTDTQAMLACPRGTTIIAAISGPTAYPA